MSLCLYLSCSWYVYPFPRPQLCGGRARLVPQPRPVIASLFLIQQNLLNRLPKIPEGISITNKLIKPKEYVRKMLARVVHASFTLIEHVTLSLSNTKVAWYLMAPNDPDEIISMPVA